MKKSSITLFLIILIIISIIITFIASKYTPFTFDENDEINSCQICRCIGSVLIMESYPEQYKCNGIEFCKNVEFSECE